MMLQMTLNKAKYQPSHTGPRLLHVKCLIKNMSRELIQSKYCQQPLVNDIRLNAADRSS